MPEEIEKGGYVLHYCGEEQCWDWWITLDGSEEIIEEAGGYDSADKAEFDREFALDHLARKHVEGA